MKHKLGVWRQVMKYHRERGLKYVDPAANPLLHDRDFAEVVKREADEHEAEKAQANAAREAAKRDKAERKQQAKITRRADR